MAKEHDRERARSGGPDPGLLGRLRAEPLDRHEAARIAEDYLDGRCLVFAFAVHWMTGWKVEAMGERGSPRFAHFAAVAPDGRIWDAAGPRTREAAAAAFALDPEWQEIDPYAFAFGDVAGVTEDDVSEACVAAIRTFGEEFDAHLVRTPELPDDFPSAPAP